MTRWIYVAHDRMAAGSGPTSAEYPAAQSMVRGHHPAGERFPVRLAAPDRARSLATADLQPHVPGQTDGLLPWVRTPEAAAERGLHRAGLRNLDGSSWPTGSRRRASPSGRTTRAPAAVRDQDRGLRPPGRPIRVGRDADQYAAATPVALQGDRPSGRLPLGFMVRLEPRQAAEAAGADDPKDQPLLNLTWDYDYAESPRLPDRSMSRIENDVDAEKILMEMNGYKVDEINPRNSRPRLLSGFSELKGDGTTACGIWIYSGVFPEPGRNRRTSAGVPTIRSSRTGDAWPDNRRVPFNRASADPAGRPWSDRKKLVWWDPGEGLWVGLDRPDFEPSKPPQLSSRLAQPHGGHRRRQPVHHEARRRRLALRAHQHQGRSPADALRALRGGQRHSIPGTCARQVCASSTGPLNHITRTPETEFPGGHHLAPHRALPQRADEPVRGGVNELQPEMFVELSPELAAERGIVHGGWVTVSTARGRIEVPHHGNREGATAHPRRTSSPRPVSLPFHWGARRTGRRRQCQRAPDLPGQNTSMHEGKSFQLPRSNLVDAAGARLATDRVTWPNRKPIPNTPASAQRKGYLTHGH